MRVVFAHHEPIDPGRARWVAIVRSLAAVAERVDVTWFTPDSIETVQTYASEQLGLTLPEGLNVVTLPSLHKRMGLTLNRVFFRAFRKALGKSNAEVLWLRSDKLAAHVAHKKIATPLVYEAHLIGELWAKDRKASDHKAQRLAELERDLYAHAKGVGAITQGLLVEIRERFGYAVSTAIVPSAVDTDVFRPVWSGGDGCTVAWVGTLQFWKGLDLLVRAIAASPGLKLKLIGGGKPDDEQRLRNEIEVLDIEDRVEIIGHVTQQEIAGHVKDVACAVHPLPPEHSISARFTSPLKIFEYMAMGLPIVAADVPSLREVLTDGENARLYEAGDMKALAGALQEVCSNSELASQLSAAAQKSSAEFSYTARAKKLIALFEEARL